MVLDGSLAMSDVLRFLRLLQTVCNLNVIEESVIMDVTVRYKSGKLINEYFRRYSTKIKDLLSTKDSSDNLNIYRR